MASLKKTAITFTKRDIVHRVAQKLGIADNRMEKPVSAVFDSVRELLSEDHPHIRVEIRNFGVLESKPTKAKPNARNPRTGEVVHIPARKKAHFKPGRLLRAELMKPFDGD